MKTIPKPLVMANQWTIVLTVIIALLSQSAWILLIPLIANLSSLLTGFHPILVLVKRFLVSQLINTFKKTTRSYDLTNGWLLDFYSLQA